MLPASIRSADSVPTNMEFTMSVNTDTRGVEESAGLIDASTRSLELYFVTSRGHGQLVDTSTIFVAHAALRWLVSNILAQEMLEGR
jgi:hypothetical protein